MRRSEEQCSDTGLHSSSRQSCNLTAVHLAMPSGAGCEARRCTKNRGWFVSTPHGTNSADKKRGGCGFVQFVSGSALSGHAMASRFFRPASAQLRCGSCLLLLLLLSGVEYRCPPHFPVHDQHIATALARANVLLDYPRFKRSPRGGTGR